MKPIVTTTWILICDASRARIFSTGSAHGPWTEVKDLVHPESRMKVHDLVSDHRGSSQDSSHAGYRTAMEPHTNPKEVTARHFARVLAEHLDKGREEGAYARLIISAPPHFLGLLRAELAPNVQKLLAHTLDKDYSQVPSFEVHKLFAEIA